MTGEEEIPEGAVAVITPDAPDVLSHVSVRARNMRVLFATCHDEAPLKQLREVRWQAGQESEVKEDLAGPCYRAATCIYLILVGVGKGVVTT